MRLSKGCTDEKADQSLRPCNISEEQGGVTIAELVRTELLESLVKPFEGAESKSLNCIIDWYDFLSIVEILYETGLIEASSCLSYIAHRIG